MQLLIPALILFLLAFAGLSIGIMFGRKGISGSCSSSEGKLADLKCTCGREDEKNPQTCENSFSVEVICPDTEPQKYQEILKQLESRK